LTANLVAAATLAPGVMLLAQVRGAAGAAQGYFVLSLVFLAVIVWQLHRRLLPGEGGRWFWRDNLPYLLVSFFCAGVGKLAQPAGLSPGLRLAWLVGVSLFTLTVTVCVNTSMRAVLGRRLGLAGFRPVS
jgi:hypothetical protein